MYDLLLGVNTGIGPTGCMDGDLFGSNLRHSHGQSSLHAAAGALRLPTDEIGAVVFQPYS